MGRGARVTLGLVALACGFATQAGTANAFEAKGSVEQVYVTGASPAQQLTLLDGSGKKVATRKADALGGLLFREVKPGAGYRVKPASGAQSAALTVISTRSAPPDAGVYEQSIPSKGYGYLTTRDGTKLAIYVHPPQDVATALPTGNPLPGTDAPVPTLIEYSGYGYANPAGPTSGLAVIANLMGFAVVDVNMRGTGCSGGAFDFFEPLQSLDGYDIVETVARQPWVAHGKVGMFGISYGGISQLFTAQTQPPSLAAISPLSVIDNTQTTLYPGGILNTGFAVAWAKERMHEALPAGPESGQPWAWKRIQEGDEVCKDNQVLHGQAANLTKKIRENDHYVPKVADPLSPVTFVDKIKVPTFMACQWQDEQTGGHCPTLASRFTGTSKKWFTFTNGAHVDSLDPETINRLYDFLKIYVAQEAPMSGAAPLQAGAPVIYDEAMGVSGVTLPPDPIQQQPTYAAAKAAFEDLPSVRVLFENGGGGEPGQPYPSFEKSFSSFPVPGTTAQTWYFGPGGALNGGRGRTGTSSFTANPKRRPPTNFTGNTAGGEGGLWTATPPYKWVENPAGTASSFITEPLVANTTVVGPGFVKAWVKSSKPDVDLQATISEVRPDGKEVFVQGGWLRADARKLDAKKSTPIAPVLSLRERDAKPLPKGKYVPVTIPLYYQGHPYRAGSRIRVTISAPGGDQPVWAFAEAKPKRTAKISIAFSKKRPSGLTLPVVPGVEVPAELPPCPGMRGQPCRDYNPTP